MISFELSKSSNMILCLALLATLYGCAQAPKELVLAVESGNAEQVNKLLAKSNVNAKSPSLHPLDRSLYTLLHIAVSRGNKDITELLIAKGADINAKDDYGFTSLHEAVSRGDKDIAGLLIDKGADIDARTKKMKPLFTWLLREEIMIL